MFDIGRICTKIAGRDAGKVCVIVDTLENGYVLIDGQTRRKKVNTRHLEPSADTVKVAKGAATSAVKTAFKALGVEVRETKPKKATTRPTKHKAKKEVKKVEKKETPRPLEKKVEEKSSTQTAKADKPVTNEAKPVVKDVPKPEVTLKVEKEVPKTEPAKN